MSRDPWFWTFLAYATMVSIYGCAILVQAIQLFRKQRADRSRGNVMPFQQER